MCVGPVDEFFVRQCQSIRHDNWDHAMSDGFAETVTPAAVPVWNDSVCSIHQLVETWLIIQPSLVHVGVGNNLPQNRTRDMQSARCSFTCARREITVNGVMPCILNEYKCADKQVRTRDIHAINTVQTKIMLQP